MKPHERDTQAVTWLCPKTHKNRHATTPLGPAIGSPSVFHSGSTLTAAAHRAISDLFPELLGNCSFEAQWNPKPHCGAVKDLAFAAPKFYETTVLPHPYAPDGTDTRWSRSISYSPVPGLSSSLEQSQSESSVLTGVSSSEEERDALYRCMKREVSLDRHCPTSSPTIPVQQFKAELAPSPSDLVSLGLKVWFL